MQHASHEKRQHQRFTVSLTAHCRVGHRYMKEPVRDLSEGGLFLRTRERVPSGTPIRVALALPFRDGPRICTLSGSVTRVETDQRGLALGLGVSFRREELSRADALALGGFLARGG